MSLFVNQQLFLFMYMYAVFHFVSPLEIQNLYLLNLMSSLCEWSDTTVTYLYLTVTYSYLIWYIFIQMYLICYRFISDWMRVRVIIVQHQNERFFSYIMGRTSYIRWDDDDVRFALDQHAELDFHTVRSAIL